MQTLKQTYLDSLHRQGISKGTIRYRDIYLDQFFEFLRKNRIRNLQKITPQIIQKYHIHLNEKGYAKRTIHSKLSVLSCFLKWLYETRHLFLDLSESIVFPKKEGRLPQTITEKEALIFLSLPDTRSRKGIRDKAILELFYSTGIRRNELVSLDLYDFNPATQMIKVMGKGRKERRVPVGDVAALWVNQYIEDVRETDGETALFLDLVTGSRLSVSTVHHIIKTYRQEANIKKRITPHTFRHACATHLLEHGANIRHIQTLLGHESPETTQIYARTAIKDLEKIHRRTHPRAKRPCPDFSGKNDLLK